jgi:hypothetical protein
MRSLAYLLPVLVLAAAACGKSPEERMASAIASAASGTDVSVEKDGERVVLGSGDEAMTISSGDSARLPASFPKDVFLPDDYTVENALESSGFNMVSLRTGGEVGPLADAAKAFMESGGWKQSMMAGDEQSRILTFQNAQSVAALSFDRADDGVVYSVQLSPASN